RLLVTDEGRHALRQRRVGTGQVHAGRQVAGVEGRVLVRRAGILQPEQLAVDHRQHVVAMESILRIKLVVAEAREDLALRMQPVGARLETRRAVVGQLAIELVLAGTGGKYRVVLEVAIEKAVRRRSQRAAGDGGRGLCGCGGGRWCGLRGWRWRGRAAGKECRGGDGGQREYAECAHGRSSPGWKAQPRCY